MENEFSRTEMLLGKEAIEKLASSYIAIFGLGGVGGYVVEALARSGIQKFDLIDSDKISITNINRQIYALHSTLGKYKTAVAKERILDINPDIKVNTYEIFLTPQNSNEFDFSKYDYIVDAIDTISAKIELVLKANEYNCPIISSMGAGNKMNPADFIIDDIFKTSVCPLAKVMRKELKTRNIKSLKVVYSKELPIRHATDDKKRIPASIAFTPSCAGLIMASEVVKDLIK